MATTPKIQALPAALVPLTSRKDALTAPRERRLSVHRVVAWFTPFTFNAANLDMSDCDIEADLNYGRD
jgi:hypothetical protein